MLTSIKNNPSHKRIIQLKSSDNSFSRILKIGKINVSHPTLIPEHPEETQFSLIMNADGQVCLMSYSYFPLHIKSKSKDVKTYMRDCLVFFSEVESIRIYTLISTPKPIYFYFNVIEYELVNNDQVVMPLLSSTLSLEVKNNIPNDNKVDAKDYTLLPSVSASVLNTKSEKNFLSKKRERDIKQLEEEKEGVNDCPICLEEKAESAYLDKCNHAFCKKCILSWSQASSECPICKAPFKKIISGEKEIEKISVKKKQFKYEEEEEERDDWIDFVAEKCYVCKRGDDAYLLLVCDNCEHHICHTYCDGLDGIPEGDWYCRICLRAANRSNRAEAKTKSKTKTKTKTKKIQRKDLSKLMAI